MQDHPSTPDDDRDGTASSRLTFGQKLRAERESQGLSIEEVAEATRVGIHHLRALEGDDFGALPGDVFVTGYLRAYAQCLGVEADPMIQQYTRERSRGMPAPADGRKDVIEEMSRILNVAEAKKRRGRSLLRLGVLASIVVLATIAAWWIYSPDADEPQRPKLEPTASVPGTRAEAPAGRTPTPVVVEEPVATKPKPSKEPADVASIPDESSSAESDRAPQPAERAKLRTEAPAARRSAPTVRKPAALHIPDHGVGTLVEDHELVGEGDRFTEGAAVWFWTRVRGGRAGQRIHHVWSREGVEKARVSLRLGGPHWRTHSRKRLWPGSAGEWAVEARDDSGRVLARREFVCVP